MFISVSRVRKQSSCPKVTFSVLNHGRRSHCVSYSKTGPWQERFPRGPLLTKVLPCLLQQPQLEAPRAWVAATSGAGRQK